ncbi:MAG: hypothetical protein MUC60_07495, partial [Oscillatoria sp. Prado101]|nr:hypothetical protein [Oscillatoria sp. Prado101]
EAFLGEGEPDRMDIVFLGQMTKKGVLYGMIVAPTRFDKGVCWSFNLDLDLEKRELEGEVFYAEDDIGEPEPGSLFLKYKRGF